MLNNSEILERFGLYPHTGVCPEHPDILIQLFLASNSLSRYKGRKNVTLLDESMVVFVRSLHQNVKLFTNITSSLLFNLTYIQIGIHKLNFDCLSKGPYFKV